ncbi:hypothetical protein J8273_0797 [Carpediemonas membranifera]|uniref:Uncharacterized protein n=1 Tax=Carpediemonas membranifera TaxID=201153 RepID=A0A8J6BD21_9EUKA|nr:hypothetical protein J8273_0797 [Carpediemonas membranifera]|eukprot:KAG9397667.1 hypothetical protein J8273_0797 [Carpediemonas membranifera]
MSAVKDVAERLEQLELFESDNDAVLLSSRSIREEREGALRRGMQKAAKHASLSRQSSFERLQTNYELFKASQASLATSSSTSSINGLSEDELVSLRTDVNADIRRQCNEHTKLIEDADIPRAERDRLLRASKKKLAYLAALQRRRLETSLDVERVEPTETVIRKVDYIGRLSQALDTL